MINNYSVSFRPEEKNDILFHYNNKYITVQSIEPFNLLLTNRNCFEIYTMVYKLEVSDQKISLKILLDYAKLTYPNYKGFSHINIG